MLWFDRSISKWKKKKNPELERRNLWNILCQDPIHKTIDNRSTVIGWESVNFLKSFSPHTPSFPFTNLSSTESSLSIRFLSSNRHLTFVLMPILLLELPSQPFRGGFAVSLGLRVTATILTLRNDAFDLFLPPLRRRHLGRVLFPPFCPPVLEPYLQSQTDRLVGNLPFVSLLK